MSQLTLQIPEPLAQSLSWLAAEQKKSIKQVAVEHLSASLKRSTEQLQGSPAAILAVIQSPPRVSSEDVAELERVIEAGHQPVRGKGIFDESEGE